jgi:Concanavalin A-like lectin/glucanases superfamily
MRKIPVLILLSSSAGLLPAETWRFDNLKKIGGHAVTVQGNPRVIETPKGKAIEFDGDDDAIFLDVHPLAGATVFTWEVIFRPDKGGKPEQRFFHLQETGSETRMLFETRLAGDQWWFDTFVRSDTGQQALIDKTKLHPLGEWYHGAAVYDGKELRSYINGVLELKADLKLTPQKAGRTSVGVRINLRDYFKGAVRQARMTKKVLKPEQFLKP